MIDEPVSIVVKDMDHCILCGDPDVAWHHMLEGVKNRRVSTNEKLIIPLCPKHHKMAHGLLCGENKAVAKEATRCVSLLLKMLAQQTWVAADLADSNSEKMEDEKEKFRKLFGETFI